MLPAVFNPRQRSLIRGNVLVLSSLLAAYPVIGLPPQPAPRSFCSSPLSSRHSAPSTPSACMRPRWSFYHGGVLLCIYMDLMALCIILFLLLYPYLQLDRLLAVVRYCATILIQPQGRPVMLKGFRDFILRGNVIDLAVAVIIGAAFS